jgi:hypothetical protein
LDTTLGHTRAGEERERDLGRGDLSRMPATQQNIGRERSNRLASSSSPSLLTLCPCRSLDNEERKGSVLKRERGNVFPTERRKKKESSFS